MNSITLHLSDWVLRDLRAIMQLRGMTGEAMSVTDTVLFKMLMAMEDGKTEAIIRFKEEE